MKLLRVLAVLSAIGLNSRNSRVLDVLSANGLNGRNSIEFWMFKVQQD